METSAAAATASHWIRDPNVMSLPPVTMTVTVTVSPRNAILCLLYISLCAMIAVADSSEATRTAIQRAYCSKCEPTLPAKEKNSSSGSAGGVIKTIRVALKPDREGIANANIYRRGGGAAVVAVPMTTGGMPLSPSTPTPPVISYATNAS